MADGPGDLSRPRADALLDEALDDLAGAIRGRLRRPEGAEARGGDWLPLVEELRRRFQTLGMRERAGETDDFGMDPELVHGLEPLLDFLRDVWWRVEVRGTGLLPEAAPRLLVSNSSGLLPWDGLMISKALRDATEGADHARFLVADWLMTLPFAQPTLARLGGVRACPENAERLLASGRSVVAFPEGVKGAAKPFRERYRLQRFGRGGVVRLALAAQVPLVPVAVVGAEEVHPILFKVEAAARSIGLPFVPVTPTFPWLGPLGAVPLPSKWAIRFGEPLDTVALGPEAARDELLVARLNEELRQGLQAMVDETVREREGVFR